MAVMHMWLNPGLNPDSYVGRMSILPLHSKTLRNAGHFGDPRPWFDLAPAARSANGCAENGACGGV